MKWHSLGLAAFFGFIGMCLMFAQPTPLMPTSGGCIGRGGGGLGGGGLGGGGGGAGGAGVGGGNGVMVDAQGVLRNEVFADHPQLRHERALAARARLGKQLGGGSKLRKISLNRLEAALRDRLDKQLGATEEMLYLAGLTRLQYVFFYPETKEIVLAGPAEAWAADAAGRARGIESGWTTLELQDLIVALRAYPPGKPGAPLMLVSIDPRPEGLAAMQQFINEARRDATPDDADFIVNGMREALGMQNIRVEGIAAKTHFAQVLIEADYRMKLIGLGMEPPPVKMATYVDRANPSQISRNALERWWFVPNYQCVRVMPDELGMQLVGNGVKLLSEHQLVAANGARVVAKHGNKASELFVTAFTAKYPELAAIVPVYAQMRNCIDLAVAAAFLQKHDYYGKAGWSPGLFNDERAYPVETLNAPRQTETCVAGIWRGGTLMTPVGGGVELHPAKALESSNLLPDDGGKIAKARGQIQLDKLDAGQWWWD